MRAILLGVCWWVGTCAAQAACVDTQTWKLSQDQQNLLQALAHQIVFARGVQAVPTVTDESVCVDAVAFEASWFTEQVFLTEYTAHAEEDRVQRQATTDLALKRQRDLASGVAKLKASVGLTEDEIKAMRER